MSKKLVFGLGILFLIVISYAIFYDLPLSQRYVVYGNATVNVNQGIAYFDVYGNLTKAVDELKDKCSTSVNIKECVDDIKEDVFAKYNFNVVNLETQDEKTFYDFTDDFMLCEQSKDKSCRCEFRKENIAADVVVDMFVRTNALSNKYFKELFKNLNADYYFNFFAFKDSKPLGFAPNLNHDGLIEIEPCSINPLTDNALMRDLGLKTFLGLEIPLNYSGDIISYELTKDMLNSKVVDLNFSLIKTSDGKVCFQDTELNDAIVNYYYFMYAYTFVIKSGSPLSAIEPGKVSEEILNAANLLMNFYSDSGSTFAPFTLDFCDFLKNQNFENYKDIFPECESFFLEDNSLNPKIIEHADFNTFKQDLVKLKKKECTLQKHYFSFDLEYNKPVFSYKIFKFEKPVFSFSVYI